MKENSPIYGHSLYINDADHQLFKTLRLTKFKTINRDYTIICRNLIIAL